MPRDFTPQEMAAALAAGPSPTAAWRLKLSSMDASQDASALTEAWRRHQDDWLAVANPSAPQLPSGDGRSDAWDAVGKRHKRVYAAAERRAETIVDLRPPTRKGERGPVPPALEADPDFYVLHRELRVGPEWWLEHCTRIEELDVSTPVLSRCGKTASRLLTATFASDDPNGDDTTETDTVVYTLRPWSGKKQSREEAISREKASLRRLDAAPALRLQQEAKRDGGGGEEAVPAMEDDEGERSESSPPPLRGTRISPPSTAARAGASSGAGGGLPSDFAGYASYSTECAAPATRHTARLPLDSISFCTNCKHNAPAAAFAQAPTARAPPAVRGPSPSAGYRANLRVEP